MPKKQDHHAGGALPPQVVDKPARRLATVLACAVAGLLCFYGTLAVNAVRWSPSLRYGDTGSHEKPAGEGVWPQIKTESPSVEAGRHLFYEMGCATCHGLEGEGHVKNLNAKTGQEVPGLTHVATDYSKAQLGAKIQSGAPTVDRLDPQGPEPPLRMPPFKGRFTETQMSQIVDYLNSLLPAGEQGGGW